MVMPMLNQEHAPVQGVLLDVIGTLFSLSNLNSVFAACGLNPSQVTVWFGQVMLDGVALTAANDFRRFSDVATNALINLDPRRLGSAEAQTVIAALSSLNPYPDVGDGLARLRAEGVRIMTLTVSEPAVAEALFVRAGLQHFVDGYLSVDAVRRWKPAPQPYHFGAAQLGWPAANVAMISSSGWDIHGAGRAGLQTGWLRRTQSYQSMRFGEADVIGSDLSSVSEALFAVRQHARA